MTNEVNIDVALHPAQIEVWDAQARFNVVDCGRRWGKTESAKGIIADEYVNYGLPIAYTCPTYKMLADFWRATKSTFYDVIVEVNESEKRLMFDGGMQLDFWSLDNYDAMRGRKYRKVIIDEAAMVANLEEAWTMAIRPTLSDFKGGAWFFSTPKGRNYFYDLYKRGMDGGEWKSFKYPTSSNPYIDADEIEAARYDLPSIVFQQEYLAEFVDDQGALVKREHLRYFDEIPKGLTIGMGVDLAISKGTHADYTAVAVVGYDRDSGNRYVLDVLRKQVGFHDVVELIKSMAAKWNPKRIYIEQVQYQAAVVQELLRKTNLPVKGITPDKDKVTRFHTILARYEQGLVHHRNGLPREFEQELLSFPIGDHDDMVDALVYADMCATKTESTGVVWL